MRIFKFLAMLTISVLLFTGCEKEEITNYAFQEISAPTNVKADFDVAQDDSGDVTITPSGEGAQVFNVYFGDGDDTPVEVTSGETVSYTYGEGEYLVRVVALGATGLTSEFNQRLLISFNAPENLEVKVEQSASNPALVTISASADFAATFDVYFGDTEVALSSEEASEEEEPVQLLPDGSIDYTYSAPGTYTIRVVAKGAGAATAETTVEVVVPEANDPVKLPITYDIPTVNYALGTFNGATFEVVANPFLSGVNTEESMVGKITNSGALYEGGAYDLSEQPVDFSGDNKTISMKFYSDQPVSVLVKFEGGTNDDRPNEVSADHGGTGWEELTFNFATDAIKSYIDGDAENGASFVPTGKYNTLVLFVEIGKDTAGTFYIDDVEFDGGNSDGGNTNGQIFDDFDANRNIGTWYGDACGMDDAFANPFKTGINTSETVLEYNDDGGQYANVGFNVDPNFDLTVDNTFSLKIYVPSSSVTGSQPNQISLKLQDGTVSEPWAQQTEIIKPIVLDEWQTVTFDFANDDTAGAADPLSRTDFNRVVLQVNGENNTDAVIAYIDDFSYGVNGGGDASGKISDDFDANRNIGTWYGDACGMDDAFANPFKTGINTSNTVLEYNDDGGQYANVGFNVDPNFDLTVDNTFSLKIYVPSSSVTGSQPNQISLKLQDGTVAEPWAQQTEIIKSIELDQWQTVTFDFANDDTAGAADPLSRTDFNRVVIQVNGENNNDAVIAYIDDFNYGASDGGEVASGGGTDGGTDGTGSTGGSSSGVAPYSPIDFETGGYGADWTWSVFENESNPALEIVSNPSVTGINTSSTVAKFTALQAGQPYAGVESKRGEDIGDFTFDETNSIVKIMVYKTEISDVGLKFSEANGEAQPEVRVANTKINEWEELTFDLSGSIGQGITGVITQIIIFPDFAERSSDNVVYFDNITFGSN